MSTVSTVNISGSKYIANRVITLAILTNGKSIIHNVPNNQDINIFINALSDFGVPFLLEDSADRLTRQLSIWGIFSDQCELLSERFIDVGESGTLLRFALGLSCLLKGITTINAGTRNRERPILQLVEALRSLGARIKFNSAYPIVIGRALEGGTVTVSGGTSSQFISALLIVTPYANIDSEIIVTKPIVSSYYIDLTLRQMQVFGVEVKRVETSDRIVFTISSDQRYLPQDIRIPKDWSSTNYLLAESAILNKSITIRNINIETNPGEAKFISLLRQMGCHTVVNPDSISIFSHANRKLSGIEIDMKDSPDSVLTLVAVAVFAEGLTAIKNINHLTHKESDRINQAAIELRKIGVSIETTDDSILILGSLPLHKGVTETHNDHRLAMCLGLIKLVNQEMEIENKDCVAKSFPSFWKNIATFKEAGVEWLEIP